MSENWNHSVCDPCWEELYEDKAACRGPSNGGRYRCCFCGVRHDSGIYIRMNPDSIKDHVDHFEKEEPVAAGAWEPYD